MLDSDGMMRVDQLLGFKMMRLLRCTQGDIDRLVMNEQDGGKIRLRTEWGRHHVDRIGAAQGHSGGRGLAALEDDLVYERLEVSDPRIRD